MKFVGLDLEGAFLIQPDMKQDERGFFTRIFCHQAMLEQGLKDRFVQSSVSFNYFKGTVRGMHFQTAPCEETKLVTCVRGGIFDVIVDLRPKSPTYCQSVGIELTSENHFSLYIPSGFAHGFQTLEDKTEVLYQITPEFSPAHARGVRWNDPMISIKFPLPISVISPRDQKFPDLKKES